MELNNNTNKIDIFNNNRPIVTIDDNCLSCCGQTTIVEKAFKLACLA